MSILGMSLMVMVSAVSASALATGLVRYCAIRAGMLDVPNARSSHSQSTPRGGGVAIVFVVCVGLIALAVFNYLSVLTVTATLSSALAVSWVGFMDDRCGLSAAVRLTVQIVAVGVYLVIVAGPPSFGISWLDRWPLLASVVTLLALIWLLNLFNFMDGIDGIAGMELAFVSFSIAFVARQSGGAHGTMLFGLLMGAAALGFLAWNWEPANIFMGDVGSGFAGLMLGLLSLYTIRDAGVTVWVPVILLGVFVSDATLTLLRRAVKGKALHKAHRTHAYQWLSRHWSSHRLVVMGALGINILWLFPLALLAQSLPDYSGLIALIAYVPLVVLALRAGAGKSEVEHQRSRLI